ncbi:MAG: hypothetical protein Q7R81_06995 [Candidatus Peregrinibacteria bacterium]|nr:hypothetical protein [Candidatus Peregrinibacteria bacterium]
MQTCPTIRPDDDNSTCKWYDGGCRGRFEVECMKKVDEMVARGIDVKNTYILPSDTDLATLDLNRCEAIEVYVRGHANETMCSAPFDRVTACVSASPNCKDIDVRDTGCQIFQDIVTAFDHAKNLQAKLPRGVQVNVTANQAVSSPRCISSLHFTIDCSGVKETYIPCSSLANFCFKRNETVICTDADSKPVNRTCCVPLDKVPLFPTAGTWQPGSVCAVAKCSDLPATCGAEERTIMCTNDAGRNIPYTCCGKENRAWQIGDGCHPRCSTLSTCSLGDQDRYCIRDDGASDPYVCCPNVDMSRYDWRERGCPQFCRGVGSAFSCSAAMTNSIADRNRCLSQMTKCKDGGGELVIGPCGVLSTTNTLFQCTVTTYCETNCRIVQ